MKIIEQIDKTSKLLDKTNRSKKSTTADLKLIQAQISNRKKIVDNIRASIQLSEEKIEDQSKEKLRLLLKYSALKKDHSNLLTMTYRKVLTENKLVYLLSSGDWEESLNRIRYTNTIENFLVKKMDSLDLTAEDIKQSILGIQAEQESYAQLLDEEKKNMGMMENEERQKDRILMQLQGDEKRLRGALIKQKREREELNQAIEAIIFAALKENSSNPANTSADGKEELSIFFGQNKKRLPWPVTNGSVISKYGKQRHPTLKNVFVSNNGVDIFSTKNANIKAVFKGEVAGSMQIPGNDHMVMIRHGNFYSVYSKMNEIYVEKGDQIRSGQIIGRLGVNNATLHFEIWENKKKLNPEDWLK